MSERREQTDTHHAGGDEGPRQRGKEANIYVHNPKRGSKKPGKDRRLQLRSRQFDENLHRKMDGQEVPKTLKVSKQSFAPTIRQA